MALAATYNEVTMRSLSTTWHRCLKAGPMILGLVLCCPVILAGCREGDRAAEKPATHDAVPPTPVVVDDLNVVFIIMDAVSASHLSCYGNDRPTTPNIDFLSDEATLFERAYAQAAWTLPSTASFLTGRYPPQRGAAHSKLVTDVTMASVLRDAGLRTAAFSENPYVVAGFGFDKGFEFFKEYFPAQRLRKNPRSFARIDSAVSVNAVTAWIEDHLAARFFVYLHLLPPHAPYDPPPPYSGKFDTGYRGTVHGSTDTLLKINEGKIKIDRHDLEHLRAQYDENLAYADHQVGRLVEFLRGRSLLDKTILIVTSDHGEAFHEHGVMLHNTTVYEEMIHVPLVIRFPSRYGKLPSRFKGVVELTDLLPTICDALRITSPESHGTSLLHLLREKRETETLARAWTSMAPEEFAALILPRYKLILDQRTNTAELFDLRNDPRETKNIESGNGPIVKELRALLQATDSRRMIMEKTEVDKTTLEKLRSLGYVR